VTTLPSVQLDHLPISLDQFVAWRDRVATTPQGGAAALVVALLLYAGDKALGEQCLAAAVDRARQVEGSGGYQGWRLHTTDRRLIESQIGKQAYLPRSYVQGATPANGYTLPAPPYLFEFSANQYSGDPVAGPYKVFVACSGAASPRPVTLRRDQAGLWQAQEWSSLVVGIQFPAPGSDRGPAAR
jgi:Domain of unknown function (DUF6935)